MSQIRAHFGNTGILELTQDNPDYLIIVTVVGELQQFLGDHTLPPCGVDGGTFFLDDAARLGEDTGQFGPL
jgi:hypothetical protein